MKMPNALKSLISCGDRGAPPQTMERRLPPNALRICPKKESRISMPTFIRPFDTLIAASTFARIPFLSISFQIRLCIVSTKSGTSISAFGL